MALPQVIPAMLGTLCGLSSAWLGGAGKIDVMHKQGIHTHLCIHESSMLSFAPVGFKHRAQKSLLWQGKEEPPSVSAGWVGLGAAGLMLSVLCAIGAGIWITGGCCPGLWGAQSSHGMVSPRALLVRKGKHIQERFIL